MSYPNTEPGTAGGSTVAFALPAPILHPELREEPCSALKAQLDRITDQLGRPEAAIDSKLVRQMLSEFSAGIRCATSVIQDSDYHWMLGRLTRLYAQGLALPPREPFITTAEAYAQVVGTISREYPDQDYSEAVGQLFCYMSRLFRCQQKSWKAVYEHIIAIPDSVKAKQLLNQAFFLEIRDWAEAGVENLFSIRLDLLEKISELDTRIEELDNKILQVSGKSGKVPASRAGTDSNVIDLVQARQWRRIMKLTRSRDVLRDQKRDEESILTLIESDIGEFEEKLRNTRRAYFLRCL